MRTIRFAHLTDPHLSDLNQVRWPQLLSKRVLGYLSWRRHRRAVHLRSILDRIATDACAHALDGVAISGDLTHIGLEHEHRQAKQWLDDLRARVDVCVVPGNHDLYRADSRTWLEAAWGTPTPFVTRWGFVSVIGVDTGAPMPWWSAGGQIADAELVAVERLLLAEQGQLRVLLIHHSPHPQAHAYRKKLYNGDHLRAILRKSGVELILHGHSHRNSLQRLTLANQSVPVFGTASASANEDSPTRAASYRFFEVTATAAGFSVTSTLRSLRGAAIVDADTDTFIATRPAESTSPLPG